MSFTFIALHYLPNAPWSVELHRRLQDKNDTTDMADVSRGTIE